jgi:3-hydroxyacyl-CoA dehydrogenase/enoyl-CoA hydratase/3-hydroxybutyryl-CoA epimerase
MAEKSVHTHWQLETDDDNVAWLTLDRVGESANSLSKEVLLELQQHLDTLQKDPPRGVIFRSGKSSGFIYGADIREFRAFDSIDKAREVFQRGQSILDAIEALPCTTLALINGFCLGGGTELALACDYRVASDNARIGLPEIKLGIFPCFGGVARSIPLIGAPAAMDIMLSGRILSARAAGKIGLVDAVVPERQMRAAARATLLAKAARHAPKWHLQLASNPLVRPLLAHYLRKQVAASASPDHYPAPYALIELWRRYGDNKNALLKGEVDTVSRLATTPTAKNLLRVYFLQERLKSLGKSRDMPAIRHVHVIGGGISGGDIAAWCASRGLKVSLQETRHEAITGLFGRADKLYSCALKNQHEIATARDRIIPDPDGDGLADADVVIETISENLAAKRDLLKTIEPGLKVDALLATSTSILQLEDLAIVMHNPQRLVGLHFFNPVEKTPLVEIVVGEQTDPVITQRAAFFAHKLGKLPMPVKSTPGFLVNRILTPYLLEAMTMVGEGIAVLQIDQAATGFGMPMGPLALADTIGLDTCLSFATIRIAKLGGELPWVLARHVEANDLGKKTGRGFYDWEKDKTIKPEATGESPPTDVAERLILRILNEAVACQREGIVEDVDLLDAGIIFGAGFAPFRGGPMQYIKDTGVSEMHDKLKRFQHRYGERYTPDPEWEHLIEKWGL